MSEAEAPRLDWRIADVADWFGVTTKTVHVWMNHETNPVPHYRPGGGVPRFNSTEVKRWGVSSN